jgi:glycosyltransferase involved in cell wall biosynthesis
LKNLTLIIPAKFEQESLPIVLKELKIYKCKKIVVLEKKDFETLKAIKNFDCDILFQKNSGYGSAIIEGVRSCKTKYLCVFNADGSFNPKEIISLYKEIKKNDFVFASRYKNKTSGSDDDSFLTFFGNKLFTFICKNFLGIKISDILYLQSTDFRICIEIPFKVNKKKFNYSDISSYERKRLYGFKKVNEFKDGLLIFIYILGCLIK